MTCSTKFLLGIGYLPRIIRCGSISYLWYCCFIIESKLGITKILSSIAELKKFKKPSLNLTINQLKISTQMGPLGETQIWEKKQ